MIKITLNNKTYKGIYRWEDMTLRQFCDLASIPFPEGYEQFIIADGKFSPDKIDEYIQETAKITDRQLNESFPEYYRKVIACLTDIPIDLLNQIDNETISERYDYYFKPFVLTLIYHVPLIYFFGTLKQYAPPDVRRFSIGLNLFKVPESVMIMDQKIPLAKEPAISFIEAADLFRGSRITRDDVNRLAHFMAIYCRKWGEKYDEQKALSRRELFMNVKMSVVWSVFFYTVRRMPGSGMTIQLFGNLPRQIREDVLRARTYRGMETKD